VRLGHRPYGIYRKEVLMFKGKKIAGARQADELFSEFVRELDEHSTNGVVKKLDIEKIAPVADHFFEQCSTAAQRMDLEDRIRLYLTNKMNYSVIEAGLILSKPVEQNIREKIHQALKTHFSDAAKYAGFVLNWALLKPIKFFKTVLEPVAVNTVLTYSLAIHPIYFNAADIKPDAVPPSQAQNSRIKADESLVENHFAIQTVRQYSQQDLDNLSSNWSAHPIKDTKKAVTVPVQGTSQPMEQSIDLPGQKKTTQDLKFDLGRRMIQPVNAATINPRSGNAPAKRTVEQRPVGDVQRVIAQNDHRIFNCYQSYKKIHTKKNGHVSVKFVISPKGMVKEVAVTYNSFNEELGGRIAMQMKSFRFSEIDSKLGEQIVYHSFYF
jgi:hypothetical protein